MNGVFRDVEGAPLAALVPHALLLPIYSITSFSVCELAVFVNIALKGDWPKTKGEFLCFVHRN